MKGYVYIFNKRVTFDDVLKFIKPNKDKEGALMKIVSSAIFNYGSRDFVIYFDGSSYTFSSYSFLIENLSKYTDRYFLYYNSRKEFVGAV